MAAAQGVVDRFAAVLSGFGVGKGDRVAILLPNVIPCVAAYFASLRIGAVAVMNNPLYTDRELEHRGPEALAEATVGWPPRSSRLKRFSGGKR